MKTVLAKNAPWPNLQAKPEPKARQLRPPAPKLNLQGDLDYFAEACEEINRSKIAAKSRAREGSTGRFPSRERLSG
jgi:hypothetical protein